MLITTTPTPTPITTITTPKLTPRLLFIAAIIFCLTPYASAGIALAIGLGIALLMGNPFPELTQKAGKPLLQGSVVLLGFGMNLQLMLASAREGFLIAMLTITLTFALGALLGKWLKMRRTTSTLVSGGTAICGGSAIAAISLSIGAAQAEISVAMGTVFLLNAAALYLFPMLGHAMHLSQHQFGTWAGIAIHDVSSVVGAASAYGQEALETATAVKLSRTLWIIPVSVIAGWWMNWRKATGETEQTNETKVTIPWFIGGFVLASLAGTFVTPIHALAPTLTHLAQVGMALTLLLIGASLSREALKSVGLAPIIQGLALWITISGVSLLALRWTH